MRSRICALLVVVFGASIGAAMGCGSPQPAMTPAPIEPLAAPSAQATPVVSAPASASAAPSSPPAKSNASTCADVASAGAGATPRETIDRARALLSRHCHRELIETLVDQDDLADVLKRTTMDELLKSFAEQDKAKDLRKTLDASRGLEPKIDPVTHVAEYDVSFGALRLRETNGRWYIKN
jgi:hypothetical protein